MTTTHDLSPFEVGYLAGGAQRAVAAALTSLRVAGAIGVRDGGELTRVGHLPRTATALEKAVYDAVTGRRHRVVPGLVHDRAVRRAVAELAARLRTAGLPGRRPLDAVLALLGARERPDEVVAEVRIRNQHLAPEANPSWTTYGPAGAALAVALHGADAIWASDPAFATALRVSHATMTRDRDRPRRSRSAKSWSTGAGGSTGSSWIWWGGGSSCGGSSSCSSGSSCGGGGGCGGGS